MDFAGIDPLLDSLTAPPPRAGLVKGNDASDLETLVALSRDPEIRAMAKGRKATRLLWEACQIPDFRKLTDEFPKDARVWYYAALSNGLATNQWRGETERLVNQGVEREKAGSPKAPEIDAVMTDLAPASKKWLDFYRQRAH